MSKTLYNLKVRIKKSSYKFCYLKGRMWRNLSWWNSKLIVSTRMHGTESILSRVPFAERCINFLLLCSYLISHLEFYLVRFHTIHLNTISNLFYKGHDFFSKGITPSTICCIKLIWLLYILYIFLYI